LSAQLVVDARNDLFGEPWAAVRGPGRIELLSKPAPSAKQITEAEYDPANEQVHEIFQDGSTEQVNL
jgi:hypothetical protein